MKSKKRSRTLIVLGALILVYIIFKLILLILAASSMDDPFAQLSKNVFELDVTDIKYISVQNGTTGKEYQFSGEELEEAAAKLRELLQPEDTILFKGSRGMKMETIIDLL